MSASLDARRAVRGFAYRSVLLFVLFASHTVCVAGAAAADEPETVVITATRIPTPELNVASSITVVTAADIELRQERTFADVLKDIPGLNVVQTGGPGGVTSVFMRGTNSNHTKVLIDGIDVSDPSNSTGAFDFGQLLTQDIERVEVLRGPQSGLYGSDAIGGVLNIITRSGNGPAHLNAAVEGGVFDTFNQAGTLCGSQDALHYCGSVAHFHSGAVPVTPLDLLASGEARNDDYDDNLTFSTRLGYDITPDFDLGLVGRYTDIHLHTTGEDFPPPLFLGIPSAQQTTAATAEYFTRLTAHLGSSAGVLEQTLGLTYSHDRTATVQPQLPAALNTGERREADWQGNLRLAGTETLVLGAEYERDNIDQPVTAGVHIGSGYAELQTQLGAHWFSALNLRYDDNSHFGSKLTYRFAPAWVIQESDTKLKASIGSGFKAPTLSELYQSFPPFFFANPNLRPETSTGYDAGIEQGVAGRLVRVGVTYYHNRIRDLITPDVTDTTYANIGRATTQGIESFVAYQPARGLTLRLDYTFTAAEDAVLQHELLRRPKHRGTFLVTWQATAAWAVNVDVLSVGTWVDGNRDFSVARLDAPGYTTANLATSYDLSPQVALLGRVDNLLNRHFENPVGFLQPRIGFYAGIKLKL